MAAIFLTIFLWVLGLALFGVTFLPMWNTNLWWVRAMEFPRLQIAIAAALVLLVALFLSGPSRLLLPALMLVACGYQT